MADQQMQPDEPANDAPAHKVAIIGAGPAGLATARALRAMDIPFTSFEKHSDVGGIWDIENPGSPMYESAHFISSKTMSGHYGFPMPESYPDYPSNRQLLTYIRAFTETYDLRADIRFNTLVDNVERTANGWYLRTRSENDTTEEHNFRWLVCASGTNWLPNRPTLVGEDEFEGEVLHSVNYRDASMLRDRKVLVVGAGNSGVDIACDAAANAESAYISLRRGYHFVPKHIFGMPADVFGARSNWLPAWVQQKTFGPLLRLLNGDLRRLGLPQPDHAVLSSHPILNSQLLHYLQHGDIAAKGAIDYLRGKQVFFKDGSSIEVDTIILATGYHWQLPYLPANTFAWEHERPQTFLKIFNRNDPSIFINGYVETNGGAYKMFDDMAYLIANTIDTQRKGGNAAERLAQFIQGPEPDLSGGVRYVESNRHSGYANQQAYGKAMRKMRRAMGWPDLSEDFYAGHPTSAQVQSAI
ncbi:NAD(P)-binding domain-containing protein [Microbulbifer agarilyticus]|uniref:flavin-containing monooxygenase n=1 Tax=Microbulbifer agarilyticus TaxID=260552 RepID=UPI001C9732DE|nr:NAD(P)-binding domain-containing protein [Microbulbifer agarilyticus]MBY6212626.1 NAD(P)-binding domain-containing protein [Microbulbifer agarilyticus]